MTSLNLGSSDDYKAGFINVDQSFPDTLLCNGCTRLPNGNCSGSESEITCPKKSGAVFQSGKLQYQCVDLVSRWPWETSSVDNIYAKDVFEHIEGERNFLTPQYRGNRGKIWVMNESHRVLKPGGTLEFLVPCIHMSDGRINPGAFADPTHVSFWTYDDRYYFCSPWNNPQGERGRLGPAYGINALFDIVKWELQEYGLSYERRSKIHAVLRAVK